MNVRKTFPATFNDFKEIKGSFARIDKNLPQPASGALRVFIRDTIDNFSRDIVSLLFYKKNGELNFSYKAEHCLHTGKVEVTYEGDERDFGYGDIGYLMGCNQYAKDVVTTKI